MNPAMNMLRLLRFDPLVFDVSQAGVVPLRRQGFQRQIFLKKPFPRGELGFPFPRDLLERRGALVL